MVPKFPRLCVFRPSAMTIPATFDTVQQRLGTVSELSLVGGYGYVPIPCPAESVRPFAEPHPALPTRSCTSCTCLKNDVFRVIRHLLSLIASGLWSPSSTKSRCHNCTRIPCSANGHLRKTGIAPRRMLRGRTWARFGSAGAVPLLGPLAGKTPPCDCLGKCWAGRLDSLPSDQQ